MLRSPPFEFLQKECASDRKAEQLFCHHLKATQIPAYIGREMLISGSAEKQGMAPN